MNQEFMNQLNQILDTEAIMQNERMSKHTTFQIGGPAQIFLTPHTVEEISQIVKLCVKYAVPYFILGNGSNILVSDEGMDGVVIQLFHNFSDFEIKGTTVIAQAGAMLGAIGNVVCKEGLTGFEFASGIPGTVGGAIMMNAGAYGGEMKDIVTCVQLMDHAGNIIEKKAEEMRFSYRHSIVEEEGYIVLSAVMELAQGDETSIAARMKELSKARREKQPLEFPSAGSTFKRPEGYFAGKLIMDADLSGYQVGGAQISEKHCGFVINRGGATAADVMQLISDVQNKVFEKFSVKLEPEVKMIGKELQ